MTESWYLAEVKDGSAPIVAFTMSCLEITAYVPATLRTERISNRTKRKEIAAPPVIDGYVFFLANREQLENAEAIKGVRQIKADKAGNYLAIPKTQMEAFQEMIEAWLQDSRERLRRGKQIKAPPKPKFRKDVREALEEFMANAFGPDTDAMQEAA